MNKIKEMLSNKTAQVVAALVALSVIAMPSHATEPATGVAAIFEAVDLSTMSGSVTTIAVAIIGITLVFVGLKLAKRGVNKA